MVWKPINFKANPRSTIFSKKTIVKFFRSFLTVKILESLTNVCQKVSLVFRENSRLQNDRYRVQKFWESKKTASLRTTTKFASRAKSWVKSFSKSTDKDAASFADSVYFELEDRIRKQHIQIISSIFADISAYFSSVKERYEELEHSFFQEKLKAQRKMNKISKNDPTEKEIEEYIHLRLAWIICRKKYKK